MDQTPVTTRTRSRTRLSKTPKIQKNKTSTPNFASENDSSSSNNILSPYMELEKIDSKMSSFENDEYFPSTQAFNTDLNVKEGVGWNYESPSTVRSKAEMLKVLNETDSPELTTEMQRKPLPYNFGLKANNKRQIKMSSPVIIDKEGLDLLNDLKVMADKAKTSEKMNVNADYTTMLTLDNESPRSEIKPDSSVVLKIKDFDSDDDSWLAASQADFEIKPGPSTEQNNYFKQPAVKLGDIPPPPDGNQKSSEDFFDDDDIDALMSQIDVPCLTSIKRTSNDVIKHEPQSMVSTNNYSSPKANNFKRMKSADDIISSHASPRNSNSAKTMKTWRKNYSSPEINIKPLPGGRIIQQSTVTPKCTKEEIEKKKQEALKRRNLKPKCSKEEIERKKQEALLKRRKNVKI